MSLTDLLLSFWGYTLETATYTLNRAPSKSVESTTYELWEWENPNLSHLQIWGCDKRLQPNKINPQSNKYYFLGYPKEIIGYQKFNDKVFVAENGHFLEKEFLAKEVSGRIVQLDEITEPPAKISWTNKPEFVLEVVPTTEPEVTTPVVETSVKSITESRRSRRVSEPPERYYNEIFILEEDEPAHYKEAMAVPS